MSLARPDLYAPFRSRNRLGEKSWWDELHDYKDYVAGLEQAARSVVMPAGLDRRHDMTVCSTMCQVWYALRMIAVSIGSAGQELFDGRYLSL